LDLLFENLDIDQSVPAKVFMSEYCQPYSHLEAWARPQVKMFGVVASNFPAFQRVLRMLKTEAGRQKLALCVQKQIPSDGTPNGATGSSDAGIEECRAVVAEMQKMRAGSSPPEAHEGCERGDRTTPPSAGSLAPEESAAGEGESAVGDDLFMKDADVDPVLVKAQSMAAQDLGHVALHRDGSSFCLDIQARILSTHRAALIIEAPTSKAKIFGEFFKLEMFPTNGSFSMWIYIGSKLDLLPFVMGLITRRFPDRTAYVITIGPVVQGGRKKSSFAICLPLLQHHRDPFALVVVRVQGQSI